MVSLASGASEHLVINTDFLLAGNVVGAYGGHMADAVVHHGYACLLPGSSFI